MNETATRQLMANTCPQTKEQKMQRQKARSEIANAKPKGKRQVKASQGNFIRQNGKARQTICKKAEYAYRAKADCKVKQIPHG